MEEKQIEIVQCGFDSIQVRTVNCDRHVALNRGVLNNIGVLNVVLSGDPVDDLGELHAPVFGRALTMRIFQPVKVVELLLELELDVRLDQLAVTLVDVLDGVSCARCKGNRKDARLDLRLCHLPVLVKY